MNKLEILYHGSPKAFSEFRISQGGNEGFGVYLTPKMERAKGYAGNGYIYTVNVSKALKMRKLEQNKMTLSIEEVEGLLNQINQHDLKEDEYPSTLANYIADEVDPQSEQSYFDEIINTIANDIVKFGDSDTQIINDLKNQISDSKLFAQFLTNQKIGYVLDYSIEPETPDVLVFDPNNIQIIRTSSN